MKTAPGLIGPADVERFIDATDRAKAGLVGISMIARKCMYLGTAFVLALLLGGLAVWFGPGRYVLHNGPRQAGGGDVYRYETRTGKTWRKCHGTRQDGSAYEGWIEIQE